MSLVPSIHCLGFAGTASGPLLVGLNPSHGHCLLDGGALAKATTFRQSALSHARLTLFSSVALPNAIGAVRAFQKEGKGKTDLGVALNVKRWRENGTNPHRSHDTVC